MVNIFLNKISGWIVVVSFALNLFLFQQAIAFSFPSDFPRLKRTIDITYATKSRLTTTLKSAKENNNLLSKNLSSSMDDNDEESKNNTNRKDAKKRLRRLIAQSKSENTMNEDQNEIIFHEVQSLELMNPTIAPASSSLLGGKWSLLYTGAEASIGGVGEEDVVANRRQKEGILGSTLTELTATSSSSSSSMSSSSGSDNKWSIDDEQNEDANNPLGRSIINFNKGSIVKNKGNFQDIDVDNGLVENRAEFQLFSSLPASVRIEGRCESTEEFSEKRLAVYFDRVEIKISDFFKTTIPLNWANGGKGPEGWVDTTYLDTDLRCGRGDKGSFFVAIRRPD